MRKLFGIGIITCVGLIIAPVAGIGKDVPQPLDVNVQNTPLPVDITTPLDVNVQNTSLEVDITTPLDVNVQNTSLEVTAPTDAPLPVVLPPDTRLNVNQSTAYQFAGFAPAAEGTIGIGSMNSYCQTEFGSLARMATTTEFFDSNWSEEYHYNAWIRIDAVGMMSYLPTEGSRVWQVVDRSGYIVSSRDINCNQWAGDTAETYGLTLSEGRLRARACSASRYVACSKPATPEIIE